MHSKFENFMIKELCVHKMLYRMRLSKSIVQKFSEQLKMSIIPVGEMIRWKELFEMDKQRWVRCL